MLRRSLQYLWLNRHKRSRGAVLFLAVGSIAILSILTLGASSGVMQELRLSKFLTDSNTSYYSALSFIPALKIILETDQTPQAVTLFDLRGRSIAFGDKVLYAEFYDEQSRININRSSVSTIIKLPVAGIDAALAGAIAAADFKVKEEMLWVESMTQEIYDGVKDLITVYGAGSLSINTASRDSLGILIADIDLIDKIIRYRAGEDGLEGTEDDGVFLFSAEIIPLLEPYGLTMEQKALLGNLVSANSLGVSSEYIVCNFALKQKNKLLSNFSIILNLTTGKIVSWKEM